MRHSRYAPVAEYQPLHITAPATLQPVGNTVNTTSATTIVAGQNTVTPASMAGIVSGMTLNIANGTGSAENVVVLSVTATTFTATFASGHSGGYTICSLRATHLGSIIVNQPGTGATLTLYNGCPNVQPDAGSAFAAIPLGSGLPPSSFNCVLDRGLFYTITGSGFDVSLMYLDG